jgi:hypothetical protein
MSDEASTATHAGIELLREKMIAASRARYLTDGIRRSFEADDAKAKAPPPAPEEEDGLLRKVRLERARRAGAGLLPDAPEHEVNYALRMQDAAKAKYFKETPDDK